LFCRWRSECDVHPQAAQRGRCPLHSGREEACDVRKIRTMDKRTGRTGQSDTQAGLEGQSRSDDQEGKRKVGCGIENDVLSEQKQIPF